MKQVYVKVNVDGESFWIKWDRSTRSRVYGLVDNMLINRHRFKFGDYIGVSFKNVIDVKKF